MTATVYSIVDDASSAHKRELGRLNDLAYCFLCAADGDTAEAMRLLDDFIALIFEGGFTTWRYRLLVRMVREGL